ncbi:putative lipase atg15 [Smittium mucronatum]|uniref:triacylglycerol lipase n=1 Tax=Smittium mucronatum TaxID=133383 RepID=A0A1R0H7R1_9FUNG|nr:putative lipase atg15 [Smittium mucronatum]
MANNVCNQNCLLEKILGDRSYIPPELDIIIDVILRYPDSYIALTGHSFGGSIATLAGLFLGVPAVSFEAPGDQLAATILGFLTPSSNFYKRLSIWHVRHTADPIYIGDCVVSDSLCQLDGYNIDSKCHF